MTGKNIVGIVFSNAYDECLSELTGLRTMGSVPFACRYRLIDFALSNMVTSGIEKVGVVTKTFQQMLVSLKSYIERLKESMEMESALKEKELMMETHLKDAQLK